MFYPNLYPVFSRTSTIFYLPISTTGTHTRTSHDPIGHFHNPFWCTTFLRVPLLSALFNSLPIISFSILRPFLSLYLPFTPTRQSYCQINGMYCMHEVSVLYRILHMWALPLASALFRCKADVLQSETGMSCLIINYTIGRDATRGQEREGQRKRRKNGRERKKVWGL